MPSPEKAAAVVRELVEQTATIVAIALAVSCLFLWSVLIADHQPKSDHIGLCKPSLCPSTMMAGARP